MMNNAGFTGMMIMLMMEYIVLAAVVPRLCTPVTVPCPMALR